MPTPNSTARPALALHALEAREVPAALTFNPATGLLRAEVSGLTLHGGAPRPGQPDQRYHSLFVSARPAGSAATAADDVVVLDDGAGAAKSAVHEVTRQPITVLTGQVRQIVVNGSERRDQIDLSHVTQARGFANLLGGVYVDARGGNDRVLGSGWRDVLLGGRDNDYLNGGAGDDQLEGGFGDDDLIGGAGWDRLFGGAGDDTFFLAADAPDFVDGGTQNTRRGDAVVGWQLAPTGGTHTLLGIEKRL